MKKQVAKFVGDNFIKMITYTSSVLVYTVDSTIALTFYSITMHILMLVFYAGLYMDWETQTYKTSSYSYWERQTYKLPSCKRFVLTFLESIVFLIILGITKHWYTFIITGVYSFLLVINIYDLVFHKDISED